VARCSAAEAARNSFSGERVTALRPGGREMKQIRAMPGRRRINLRK